jgi:hypothetical protein
LGYSGWYPVSGRVKEVLDRWPEEAETLTSVPVEGSSSIYLFNYSVDPRLKGSGVSRALLWELAAEVRAERPTVLCAATVSEDGERVARRFGLEPVATVWKEGLPWKWFHS